MIRKQRAAGFTLIEVIVASIVLVIAIGFVTISFNQLSGRDADNQANKISRWLESLSDRSVLEGGLYGFRVMGNQLQAISWFDHQWFIVEHEGLVELPEDLIFSYTEDDQPVGFFSIEDLQELETTDSAGAILLEDDVVEPFMVFLPSGQPLNQGELILSDNQGLFISVTWSPEEGVNFADTQI